MHLSFVPNIISLDARTGTDRFGEQYPDIDSIIFYSVPTSFFVIDSRIPTAIRELISEAEGCLKMNFLTGASACARKAIYELGHKEKAEGDDYESKIKSLKVRFPAVDSELFDILAHIQGMTSEKVHEQSWDKWDSPNLKVILETLKAVLHEIYVIPDEKKKRSAKVLELKDKIRSGKDLPVSPPPSPSPPSAPITPSVPQLFGNKW